MFGHHVIGDRRFFISFISAVRTVKLRFYDAREFPVCIQRSLQFEIFSTADAGETFFVFGGCFPINLTLSSCDLHRQKGLI